MDQAFMLDKDLILYRQNGNMVKSYLLIYYEESWHLGVEELCKLII